MEAEAPLQLSTATPAKGARLPTPPASPCSSLSDEINAATRQQHTGLNRMLSELLPKALPPYTNDSWTLAYGLVPFAQIFISFERAWAQLPGTADTSNTNPHHRHDLLKCMSTLRPEGLTRSARFSDDLQRTHEISATADPFLNMAYQSPGVDHDKLIAKPHLLLAYAWVMYMAVFSGGRWIRSQLSTSTTDDFWFDPHPATRTEKRKRICGISFLSFPEGTHDGEEIKRDFKERLAAIELVLTEQERHEVVVEAVELFTFCIWTVQRIKEAQIRRSDELAKQAAGVALVVAFAFDVYSYISVLLYKGLLWIRHGRSRTGDRQHIDRTATRYHRHLHTQ